MTTVAITIVIMGLFFSVPALVLLAIARMRRMEIPPPIANGMYGQVHFGLIGVAVGFALMCLAGFA